MFQSQIRQRERTLLKINKSTKCEDMTELVEHLTSKWKSQSKITTSIRTKKRRKRITSMARRRIRRSKKHLCRELEPYT
jgi:hypothetical protein